MLLESIGSTRHKYYDLWLRPRNRILAERFYKYKIEKANRYVWLALIVQLVSNLFNTTNSFMQGDYLKAVVSLNIILFVVPAFIIYLKKRQELLIFVVHLVMFSKYVQISFMFYRDWLNRD